MGVDSIGKGGGLPPGGAPPGASSGGAAGEFRVDSGSAASAPVGPNAPSAALEKLQSGEVDLDQYLDARVDDAVRHLEGKLSAPELDFVRGELRQQLAEDPVLVELVRRATGTVPTDNQKG